MTTRNQTISSHSHNATDLVVCILQVVNDNHEATVLVLQCPCPVIGFLHPQDGMVEVALGVRLPPDLEALRRWGRDENRYNGLPWINLVLAHAMPDSVN